MHCNVCGHERNRAFYWRRAGGFLIRLRECLDCGRIWGTVQKDVEICEECGSEDVSITKVSHNGHDQKIRTHSCHDCGNKHFTVEKKISGEIDLIIPESKNKQMRLAL